MLRNVAPGLLLLALTLLAALVYPDLGATWFAAVEKSLARVARRRTLSVLLCGALALSLRAALLPWLPIPSPVVNDEFSFMLAADTFAHGRLANPVHPMWLHFETFHIIFHPTYASMYQPLQGIVMAAGKVIAGHPFWGIWFSVGAMCAAICWALQAWLPPTWALLGGLLPVIGFGVVGYWDDSYWGGAVPATAGALVLGALGRILRRPETRDAVVMGLGITMLVNSRPYEGSFTFLAALSILAAWVWRKHPPRRVWLNRIAVPMLVVLVIGGAASMYYCWRVTGSPVRLPQQVNRDTYAMAKYFYWQTPAPAREYHNKPMRDFFGDVELTHFLASRTPWGIIRGTAIKTSLAWIFYVGPTLTIPLFLLPRVVRDRRTRYLLIAAAACFTANSLVAFYSVHYSAPAAVAIVAILVQGIRHLRQWKFEGRATGLFLARATIVATILMIPIEVRILRTPPAPDEWQSMGPARKSILADLTALPDRQLVFVRYRPKHDPLGEWVFNDADIDASKVVWARDLGEAENEELLRYYPNRRAWMLDGDARPPKMTPYPAQTHPSPAIASAEINMAVGAK